MAHWREVITPAAIEAHERWVSSGRRVGEWLVVEGGGRLGRAEIPMREFSSARFDRCDFMWANMAAIWLPGAELSDCNRDDVELVHAALEGISVTRCTFLKAHVVAAALDEARICGLELRGVAAGPDDLGKTPQRLDDRSAGSHRRWLIRGPRGATIDGACGTTPADHAPAALVLVGLVMIGLRRRGGSP